jgi:hypothetical protein
LGIACVGELVEINDFGLITLTHSEHKVCADKSCASGDEENRERERRFIHRELQLEDFKG